jgi:hypothetical protein
MCAWCVGAVVTDLTPGRSWVTPIDVVDCAWATPIDVDPSKRVKVQIPRKTEANRAITADFWASFRRNEVVDMIFGQEELPLIRIFVIEDPLGSLAPQMSLTILEMICRPATTFSLCASIIFRSAQYFIDAQPLQAV